MLLKSVAPWMFLLVSLPASAVIFGEDNRQDVVTSARAARLARSTAISVSPVYFKRTSDRLDLAFSKPTEEFGVCADERFAAQPTAVVNCTGFLVGADLLVTAGHCMVNRGEIVDQVNAFCTDFSWLFDYQAKKDGSVDLNGLPADRLVGCKRVIYAAFVNEYDKATNHTNFRQDFALIQLERPVTGSRTPFKISQGPVKKGEALSMIGYPIGLPAKIADHATVKGDIDEHSFRTDLDAMGGNSGSPVLNSKDEVVGILVRSYPDDDYVGNPEGCLRANRCDSNGQGCTPSAGYVTGTEVQKITELTGKVPF